MLTIMPPTSMVLAVASLTAMSGAIRANLPALDGDVVGALEPGRRSDDGPSLEHEVVLTLLRSGRVTNGSHRTRARIVSAGEGRDGHEIRRLHLLQPRDRPRACPRAADRAPHVRQAVVPPLGPARVS